MQEVVLCGIIKYSKKVNGTYRFMFIDFDNEHRSMVFKTTRMLAEEIDEKYLNRLVEITYRSARGNEIPLAVRVSLLKQN